MKLKKKVKRILILILIILVGILIVLACTHKSGKTSQKEVKVLHKIEKYGYSLKDNKTKEYQKMYKELTKILDQEEVVEEDYVKKVSEMFIYDFYTLKDKKAQTDVGGVDFVYQPILENFLQNAQDTYYKYVENNIYDNRKQQLPEVEKIEIKNVEQKSFKYGDQTDEKAYFVTAEWTYTESKFSSYQKTATLVWIHEEPKLSLVELQ